MRTTLAWRTIFLLLATLSLSVSSAQYRYEFVAGKLGTVCRLVFYAKDSLTAQYIQEKAFSTIDTLNEVLSDYNENSEIRRLCDSAGTGKMVAVSKDLYEIIAQSLAYSQLSKGAFDITVGNYVQLWRRARRQGALPTPAQLAKAKTTTGYQKIKLYPTKQAVELLVKGMRLDVGAVGKGFIADKVLTLLSQLGVNSALVDLGGDIALGEAPPNEKGWQIEIAYTDHSQTRKSQKIVLSNCAIATSGDTFQYISIGGQRYSHIIHPKTGLGLTEKLQVTVVAKSGSTADAFASALSVLGKKKGFTLAQRLETKKYILGTQIIYYTENQTFIKKTKSIKELINACDKGCL